MNTSLTGSLTSSKMLYLVAAVVPFGFVALAVLLIARRYLEATSSNRIAAAMI